MVLRIRSLFVGIQGGLILGLVSSFCVWTGLELSIGPGNAEMNKMYSDKFAPPGTDAGATINAQWPLGMLQCTLLDSYPV